MENLEIVKITNKNDLPYSLLFLADPSEEAVTDYIERGEVYGAYLNNEIVGEYVLLPTRPFTVELVNVAVDENYQGRGIGKKIVLDAIRRAQQKGYRRIEVGTGDAGIGQLALYQKCGFSIVGVDANFFRKYCQETIYENGIECKHMIRMSIDFEK